MSSTPKRDAQSEEDLPTAEDPPAAEDSVTAEEWRRLRSPFSRDAYLVDSRAVGRSPECLAGEEGRHPAIVDLHLRPRAVRGRLDCVLGPGRYSYRFEPGPQEGGQCSIFCHLRIEGAARTGIGAESSLKAARRTALPGAAAAFGIGASGRAAGPVTTKKEIRNHVPGAILDSLEQGEEPALWAPEESAER